MFDRILKENRVFAGLWYGSKPDMSLFLKPVAKSLKSLAKEGTLTSLNVTITIYTRHDHRYVFDDKWEHISMQSIPFMLYL